MSLTLPEAPTLGDALQQALAREIDGIAGALSSGPTEDGVHQARKACKRARAIAALLVPALGRRRARALARAFRDVARPLGPVRDADVLRKRLVALGRDPERIRPPDRDGPLGAALAQLDVTRQDVQQLELVLTPEDVRAGWVGAYHGARRDRADVDPSDDESVHTWRKSVKALWIQTDLLSALAPDALRPLVGPLDVLQETLGDHHDLAVLAVVLADDPTVVADARVRGDALLARARAQGRVLLAPRPRHQARWVAQAWV